MHENDEEVLKKKLERIRASGVVLFLDGKGTSPEEIACKCIQEECTYMADYVLDDEGKLKELRYDKVSLWNWG